MRTCAWVRIVRLLSHHPRLVGNLPTFIMPNKRPAIAQTGLAGKVRIIAGHWRGRRLPVPDHLGLRPTSDRIRETLFNWLAPVIDGASCLDLFSGSGALGFEAASRGAGRVDLVDDDRTVYRQLVHTRDTLSANQIHIHCEDALTFLATTSNRFNIVFLDPPFRNRFAAQIITTLEHSGKLKPHSLIYLENSKHDIKPILPETWRLHREKNAGHVAYRLYEFGETTT